MIEPLLSLEAAHIKPFAESGPNHLSNGILLRADVHKLYDYDYLTITKDYKVEVSRRIREVFDNGKEYYRFHGNNLQVIPENPINRQDGEHIAWHNENVFNGRIISFSENLKAFFIPPKHKKHKIPLKSKW